MDTIHSATATPLESQVREQFPVVFKGQALEFFKIWIVNLLLTIITLGIYSAWAKVRTRRYLYGNTSVAGSSFEYHGDPLKILKGRLILGALFLGYTVGGKISPVIGFVFGLGLAIGMPFVFVRGMMFNLYMTSYRGVRFGFQNAIKQAYIEWLKAGLAIGATLGLGYPIAIYLYHRFAISNSRFGQSRFTFDGTIGDFYFIFFMAVLVVLAPVGVVGLLIRGIGWSLMDPATAKVVLVSAMIFSAWAALLLAAGFLRAKIANEVALSTKLGKVGFISRLSATRLIFIYVTNAIAISLTLGLAVPWALVRTMRYRASKTFVVASVAELNSFVQSEKENPNAMSDAALDFADFDFGI